MNSMRLIILLTFILYETQRSESTLTLLKTLVSKHLHPSNEEPTPVECEPTNNDDDDTSINKTNEVIMPNGETYDIIGEIDDDRGIIIYNDEKDFEIGSDKYVEYVGDENANEKIIEIDDVKQGIVYLKDKVLEKLKSMKSKIASKKEQPVKPVTETVVQDIPVESHSPTVPPTTAPISRTDQPFVYVGPETVVELIAAEKLMNANRYTPNVKINGDIDGGVGFQDQYVNIQRRVPPVQRKMYFLPSPPYPLMYNYHPYGPTLPAAKTPTLQNTPYYYVGPDYQNQRVKFEPANNAAPMSPVQGRPVMPWIRYAPFENPKPAYANFPAYTGRPASSVSPQTTGPETPSPAVYPSAVPAVVKYSTMQPVIVYPAVNGDAFPVPQGAAETAQTDDSWRRLYENGLTPANAEGPDGPLRGDIPFAEQYGTDSRINERSEADAGSNSKKRRHVGGQQPREPQHSDGEMRDPTEGKNERGHVKRFVSKKSSGRQNAVDPPSVLPSKIVSQSAPVVETGASETTIDSQTPIALKTPVAITETPVA